MSRSQIKSIQYYLISIIQTRQMPKFGASALFQIQNYNNAFAQQNQGVLDRTFGQIFANKLLSNNIW